MSRDDNLIEARSKLYSIIVEGLEVPSDNYAARLVSAIEHLIYSICSNCGQTETTIRTYVEAYGGDNVSKEIHYLRILLKIIDDLRKPIVDEGQKIR